MVLQHYLPATYLAGFSHQSILPSRDRIIFVGDKQSGKIFKSKAANVGGINNLYTLLDQTKEGNSIDIDLIWEKYETRLESAKEELIGRSVNASEWSRVLIPFASGLLIRGPDFIKRFNARLTGINIPLSVDNANMARILELQRLLGPISAAKWVVMKTRGDGLLITNDLGYYPFKGPEDDEIGIAVPLDLHFILGIIPKKERVVVRYSESNWQPIIKHVTLSSDNHVDFCKKIAKAAQRFIFGPDEQTVKDYLYRDDAPPADPEIFQISFMDSRMLRAHEFTWHRMVSALGKTPDTPGFEEFNIDWSILASGWVPPVVLPINLPEFPPALKKVGNSIKISFYDPELYYNIAFANSFEKAGEFNGVIAECNKGLLIAKEGKDLLQLYNTRGNALDEMGNHELAINDFDEALKIDPNNSNIHLNKAISLQKSGEFEKALNEYDYVIKINPKLGEAFVNRGNLHAELQHYKEAISDYKKGLRFLADKKIIAIVYNNLGNVFLQLENYEEAKKQFDKSILMSDESNQKGMSYFRRAICYILEDDIDSALLDLRESLIHKPNFFEAYLLKSQMDIKKNDTEQAIKDYSEAMKFAPNEIEKAKIFGLRGIQYGEKGDFVNSISDFNIAIDLLPEDGAIYFNKGYTNLLKANIPDSIVDFDKAIELEPTMAKAYHDRGLAFAIIGENEKAISDYKMSINLFGENTEKAGVLRNLSTSLSSLGKYQEAQECINEAEKIIENEPKNTVVKARLEYAKGNNKKSINLFSLASKKLKGKLIIPFIILPLISEGKNEEALTLIHLFLESNPVPLYKLMLIKELEAIKDKSGKEAIIEELKALLN
jgi:tetratricopeptide (TPR) repeat protein